MSRYKIENANNFYQSPQSQLNAVSGQEAVDPKFISFSGRLDQFRYAIFNFYHCLISMIVIAPVFLSQGFDSDNWDKNAPSVILAIVIVVLISCTLTLSFNIRRFHDIGRSGWYSLFMLIPIISYFLNIYLLVKKGNEHENHWGACVMEPSKVLKSFASVVIALNIVYLIAQKYLIFTVIFLGFQQSQALVEASRTAP